MQISGEDCDRSDRWSRSRLSSSFGTLLENSRLNAGDIRAPSITAAPLVPGPSETGVACDCGKLSRGLAIAIRGAMGGQGHNHGIPLTVDPVVSPEFRQYLVIVQDCLFW